jgi:ferredoxin
MNACIDSAQVVAEWVASLAQESKVYFPQPDGEVNLNFLPVTSSDQITFSGYRPTVVPPVKRLMPDRELLFSFTREPDGSFKFGQAEEAIPTQVLAGVRPCDLKGIALMDRAFGEEPADPLYLKRRAAMRVIAVNCLEPCTERCFCSSTGSLGWLEGADVLLTPVGEEVTVEALTPAGEAMLASSNLKASERAAGRRLQAEANRPEPFGRQLTTNVEDLPDLLRAEYDSPVYAEYGEKCFSCGTCNLVCPTCYCFEVSDELSLDRTAGTRTRTWDACMNPHFSEVAGGHNFRDEIAKRQRHRIKRKFEYLTERFELGSYCVGCGRCGTQCTTGIDIFDMVNDIVARAGGDA